MFRRGPGLRGRTIAYDASKTAATLDRDLVSRLASSDARLDVTISEVDGEPAPGALFVVSLPIGNDGDISRRAIDVLERADLVLAEDTRRLHALAQRSGIAVAPATSYHDHNELERADGVLERLRAGARVALVSDAGTPLCSDPGYVVVSRAAAEGIAVCPVPGPSAVLAVLAACGLPVDRFVFGGFLPRRSAQRRRTVQELTALGCAVVCYEAAPRLAALLADVAAVRPAWQVVRRSGGDEDLRGVPSREPGRAGGDVRRRQAARASARSCSRRPPTRAGRSNRPRSPTTTSTRCSGRCSRRVWPRRRSRRRCARFRVSDATRRTSACSRSVATLRRTMTITRVVGKGRTVRLDAAAFTELRSGYAAVAVDVGTGDGRFAYQLACDDAHRLVVGIDALAEPMGERAATAARKPARGGRPNLVFVHAAVETLPEELAAWPTRSTCSFPGARCSKGSCGRATTCCGASPASAGAAHASP